MSLNYTDNHTRSDLMTRFRDLDTEQAEEELTSALSAIKICGETYYCQG